MADDLYGLMEDPFAWPHDPCLSAAELVFPIDAPCSLRRDLFMLAESRGQHAKALFALAEDLRGLSEGLLSFPTFGCRESQVLCSPAMVLWMLAEDLRRV